MIVGYARVSTDDQRLDLQIDALKAAGCEKIFSDKISGSTKERPELSKCLAFLKKDDVLVVWKLDRLGRSLHNLVDWVTSFNDRGIGFRVTTAPIDTTTPSGKLIFGIFASLAEFERELIRERVNAGMAAARARGVKIGRPATLDKAAKMAVVSRFDAGYSIRRIAKHLNIPRTTIWDFLHKPSD